MATDQHLRDDVHMVHACPDWCLGKSFEADSFSITAVLHPNQVKELNLARALVHGGLLFLWIPHMHLRKIFASLSETGLQPLRTYHGLHLLILKHFSHKQLTTHNLLVTSVLSLLKEKPIKTPR